MNHEAVYRTAPATPGLLKKISKHSKLIVIYATNCAGVINEKAEISRSEVKATNVNPLYEKRKNSDAFRLCGF